jgi:hypothetical protein
MSNAYTLRVSNVSDDSLLVAAHGSLSLVSYGAREALKTIAEAAEGVEFRAVLVETEGVEGDTKRTITAIAGDADDVTAVLKRKLSKERKAVGVSEDGAEVTGDQPTEDQPTEDAGNDGTQGSRRGRRSATTES